MRRDHRKEYIAMNQRDLLTLRERASAAIDDLIELLDAIDGNLAELEPNLATTAEEGRTRRYNLRIEEDGDVLDNGEEQILSPWIEPSAAGFPYHPWFNEAEGRVTPVACQAQRDQDANLRLAPLVRWRSFLC